MDPQNGKDEFFIGWEKKIPKNNLKFLRKSITLIFIITIIVSAAYSLSQKKFPNSKNELGYFKQISGVIYEYPVPLLKVKLDDNNYQSFLLVGSGKHNAYKTISHIKSQIDGDISSYKVRLNATPIFYDGKVLVEIPLIQNTMDTISPLNEPYPDRDIVDMGFVELKGQIIDPKCYFGLMKPAEGKIHRSCAIRCISGGIPPVLKIQNKEGISEYFIILGKNGQPINKLILNNVAIPVLVKGQLQKVDDWFVLKVDPEKDILRNPNPSATNDYINDLQ
ncbi:MAG: hypothetical protein ACEPOV_09155 [Hyphomicrobiales bacterium]